MLYSLFHQLVETTDVFLCINLFTSIWDVDVTEIFWYQISLKQHCSNTHRKPHTAVGSGGSCNTSYLCTSGGGLGWFVDLSETKWADVSLIKCRSYSIFKNTLHHTTLPPVSHTWHDCWFDSFSYRALRNVFLIDRRCEARDAALWNDARGGKHKQMFATKHVQTPPSPRCCSPTPALQKATAAHVTHY